MVRVDVLGDIALTDVLEFGVEVEEAGDFWCRGTFRAAWVDVVVAEWFLLCI